MTVSQANADQLRPPGGDNHGPIVQVGPARRLDVNELSLFIAGTSGETAVVVNPLTGERVLLRKTLQRDYLIPGDALPRGSKPVELTTQHWVMR